MLSKTKYTHYLPSITSMSMVLMPFPWILSTSLSGFNCRARTLQKYRKGGSYTCIFHDLTSIFKITYEAIPTPNIKRAKNEKNPQPPPTTINFTNQWKQSTSPLSNALSCNFLHCVAETRHLSPPRWLCPSQPQRVIQTSLPCWQKTQHCCKRKRKVFILQWIIWA